jgi:hypothetical protein
MDDEDDFDVEVVDEHDDSDESPSAAKADNAKRTRGPARPSSRLSSVRPIKKPLVEGAPSGRGGHTILTQQQKMLADEYLLHGNKKLAAQRSGFTESRAAVEALKKPHVRRYISECQARVTKSTIATRQERLEILSGIVRGDDDAKQDQVMAAKLMAQMEGELVHRIGGHNGGPIEIAAMSTHELLAIIARFK